MHKVTTHKSCNYLNSKLDIEATDDPGPGGAHNSYQITTTVADYASKFCTIKFHTGDPKGIDGIKGISDETLLAVVIDRLKGFQKGKFGNEKIANALVRLEECLMWLQSDLVDKV